MESKNIANYRAGTVLPPRTFDHITTHLAVEYGKPQMGAFSKFYQDHILKKSCQELFFHTGSCSSNFRKDIPLFILSNFKYFMPICLLPAIIKLHRMDKKKFQRTLEYYVHSSIIGTAVGCTTMCSVCLLRNLLGQFGYYTFTFVPSTIGGFLVNLAPPRVAELFETSIFQCNIDSFLIMRSNFVTRLLADSRLLQTLVFMLCSGLILQGKYLHNLKGFWFLPPNPIPDREKENRETSRCELHKQRSCNEYLLHGLRQYIALGLTLDMVKTLMGKANLSQSSSSKFLGKLKNLRIRSTALLTVYVGLYRFTHCFLNRHHSNHSHSLNHFISAFLAGVCFCLYPQSTLFSFALVQATRTLWRMVKIENADTKNTFLKFLFRIPIGRLLFPFGLGALVHLVCFRPEYSSPLASTIANGVTNNYPNHLKKELSLLQQRVMDQMAKGGQC